MIVMLPVLSAGLVTMPGLSAQAAAGPGNGGLAGVHASRTAAQPETVVSLYRLYRPATGHHFYTTSWAEAVNAFTNLGYRYEGTCCQVLSADSADGVPLYRLYRLYRPASDDHFYTTNWAEAVNAFTNLGYTYEGIQAHVWTSGSTPLYRLYRPANGDHFYTTNWAEAVNAFTNLGYRYEGIQAYVQP
jgi:hypothetical protein